MGRAVRQAAVAALGLCALLAAACGAREPLPAPRAYERYCARCHGGDGLGDPKAVRLNPRLDLVRSEMVREGDGELVRARIAAGRGAMPGFERKLRPEEIEALTAYTLERFGAGTPAPAETELGYRPPAPAETELGYRPPTPAETELGRFRRKW